MMKAVLYVIANTLETAQHGMRVQDLLQKMEAAEDAFLQTEFLAPILPGRNVRVRIPFFDKMSEVLTTSGCVFPTTS